ncbi:MAG: histidine ammonia-lyase [Clostridiales bacterium]|nr:histidine ammonia-lyase [Clostridiales bacterium]
MQHVTLTGYSLTLNEVIAVARYRAKVRIADKAIAAMEASRNAVEQILDFGQPVYGINTGFGSLANVQITREQAGQLQTNLILSHAVGCGDPFPNEVVRAMMLLRANALCQGYSGIRPLLVQNFVKMLNAGVHPVVPEKGSLGASGDLAPLSHMALVLLGHGEAEYEGQVMPGQAAMDKAGIGTQLLLAKEGLALINGTQAMGAVGALALYDAERISQLGDIAAGFTMEALLGRLDAFDQRVHAIRPHKGQQTVAANLRALCADSPMIHAAEGLRVQDAYSLRCVPQVHGAVRDALAHVRGVLEIELNAVTDNPLIFAEDRDVISGGNFHGEPLALALDYLGIAVAELANISERRLERMVNHQLSNGLPPFLSKAPGVNSGMMIIQYTAASMVSENKVLAHPASVDSIPSSANQEDHVSMGTTAARKARLIVENCFSVLALEFYAAAQAIDLREGEPNAYHKALHQLIRSKVAFIDEDRELRPDVNAMNVLIRENDLIRLTQELIAEFR